MKLSCISCNPRDVTRRSARCTVLGVQLGETLLLFWPLLHDECLLFDCQGGMKGSEPPRDWPPPEVG